MKASGSRMEWQAFPLCSICRLTYEKLLMLFLYFCREDTENDKKCIKVKSLPMSCVSCPFSCAYGANLMWSFLWRKDQSCRGRWNWTNPTFRATFSDEENGPKFQPIGTKKDRLRCWSSYLEPCSDHQSWASYTFGIASGKRKTLVYDWLTVAFI